MATTLPNLLFVRAFRNSHILFRVEAVRGYWKLSVIENPATTLLQGGRWGNSGENRTAEYIYTHLSENGPVESKMKKLSSYIHVPALGNIPEYSMTKLCYTIGDAAAHVVSGRDSQNRWHFNTTDIEVGGPAPSAPASSAPLPSGPSSAAPLPSGPVHTHIMNGFIEYSISQGTECPITMEPITRKNVAVTPCGHLFSMEGITDSINRFHSCPTCRTPCELSSIMRYA
jgi:hypothetical protein